MNIKELIMLSDIYVQKAYADFCETPWGIMFYDDENPTMHDVNHACIVNEEYFESALEEIKAFYASKGLAPRIYLLGAQHRQFERELSQKRFKVYRAGSFKHFLLSEQCVITPSHMLNIRQLKSKNDVTEKLLDNLYGVYMNDDPDTINRSRRLLRRVIQSEKCRLFCGFYDNEPACLAMLVEGDYGMLCFDLVETAEKFKGRGFACELVACLVKLCGKPAFLYSENPCAIRIYEEAGFRRIKITDEPFSYRAVFE